MVGSICLHIGWISLGIKSNWCEVSFNVKFFTPCFFFLIGPVRFPGPVNFTCDDFVERLSLQGYSQHRTRLHSSRMHTAHLLTVSPSMHCWRGGLLPGGLPAWGGACSWGRDCSWGGVPAPGGSGIPACTEADPPPYEQNSWHTLKLRLRAVNILSERTFLLVSETRIRTNLLIFTVGY